MVRGDRAREPIFKMAQPEIEAKNYNLAEKEGVEKDGSEGSVENVDKANLVVMAADVDEEEAVEPESVEENAAQSVEAGA